MNHLKLIRCILLGLIFSSLNSFAQGIAPASFANEFLTMTITNGSGPFTTNGSYKFFTSALGTNFNVLGNVGVVLNAGTYSYTKTATNSSVLNLTNSLSGAGRVLSLNFTGTNTGSFILSYSAGSQGGTFVATNYASLSAPGVFLPAVTNGQFKGFLSGQPGFQYTIQSSTNNTSWTDYTNATITNLTTSFNDTNRNFSRRFYRARINATAFAPSSISNKTFNLTFTSGSAPLVTNGIGQWMATNANQYKFIGGPGTTNGSGTFTYTQTKADTANLSYTDSQTSVSYSEQLVFTSATTGHFYLTAAGGFSAGTFSLSDGPVSFLGNIKFTTDTNRGTSVLFPANGTAVNLMVTNASGYIWKLAIPGDALLVPRTISMTPFATVDTSQTLYPLTNGVQLEPDGIHFNKAVTLTVTPPSPFGTNAALMLAGDDGSAIYLVNSTNQTGSYSTKLFHFTSGGVSDPSASQQNAINNQLHDLVFANYQAAVATVQILTASSTAPEPPDYDESCDPNGDATQEVALDVYLSTLFLRETEAIRQLNDAALNLLSIGGDPTGVANAPLLSRQLVEVGEFGKITQLILSYQENPKKFMAVYKAAQSAITQDILVAGPGTTMWNAQLTAWAKSLRPYYLKKLTDEHDYSMVAVLPRLQSQIDLMGFGGDDSAFYAQLENALTFHVAVDISLNATAHEEAKGELTMTANGGFPPITGTGTMNYLSGTATGGTLVPGQSYSETVSFDNVDACHSSTASIVINRFALDSENWNFSGHIVGISSFMQQSGKAVFQPYLATSGSYAGQYVFTANLQNRNVQAINQTFTGNGTTGGNVMVNIILTHTPQ